MMVPSLTIENVHNQSFVNSNKSGWSRPVEKDIPTHIKDNKGTWKRNPKYPSRFEVTVTCDDLCNCSGSLLTLVGPPSQSVSPINAPSRIPTNAPSRMLTNIPSRMPTITPTLAPTTATNLTLRKDSRNKLSGKCLLEAKLTYTFESEGQKVPSYGYHTDSFEISSGEDICRKLSIDTPPLWCEVESFDIGASESIVEMAKFHPTTMQTYSLKVKVRINFKHLERAFLCSVFSKR